MSSTGYIKDGIYHRTQKIPIADLVTPQQSTYKQGDHHRQRFDHAAEIIQPYLADGSPNPAMAEAWPEDAVRYGFLPGEDVMGPERIEAARPAEGAIPWGQ